MHEFIELGIGIALFLLGCGTSVLGWIVNRFVRDLDNLEEEQDEFQRTQEKYGNELRDTRSAIARIEGKLDIDPFHYTS